MPANAPNCPAAFLVLRNGRIPHYPGLQELSLINRSHYWKLASALLISFKIDSVVLIIFFLRAVRMPFCALILEFSLVSTRAPVKNMLLVNNSLSV